jgi:hypothetical protein
VKDYISDLSPHTVAFKRLGDGAHGGHDGGWCWGCNCAGCGVVGWRKELEHGRGVSAH